MDSHGYYWFKGVLCNEEINVIDRNETKKDPKVTLNALFP